jgi:hypothetical protein
MLYQKFHAATRRASSFGGTSSQRGDVKPKYLQLIFASSRRGCFRIDDDEAMTRNLNCDVAMSEN